MLEIHYSMGRELKTIDQVQRRLIELEAFIFNIQKSRVTSVEDIAK